MCTMFNLTKRHFVNLKMAYFTENVDMPDMCKR